jgi:hypothetical protein
VEGPERSSAAVVTCRTARASLMKLSQLNAVLGGREEVEAWQAGTWR